MLQYEKDKRIDQNEIRKLAMSIKNRDSRPAMTSTNRVVCPDCNMHYWNVSSIWTQEHIVKNKKHIGLCNRAQTLRRALLALQMNDMVNHNTNHHSDKNELQENATASNNDETTIAHLDDEGVETQNEPKPSNTSFNFQSMIQEYIQENNPQPFLKNLMLHQVKLCKNRQEMAELKGLNLEHSCDGCLQLFTEPDLVKHQRKRKKECTEASFLLKALYQVPKFRAIIHNKSSQKINLEDFIHLFASESPELYVSPLGISGKLVSDIGRIYINMNDDTIIHFINDKPVNKQIIHILLSGVNYHPTDVTTSFFWSGTFEHGDTWVQGTHLEMFIDLLYQNDYFYPDGQTKPILISPSFATHFLGGTDGDSVGWLHSYLTNRDIWKHEALQANTFLIPVNIHKSHWIMIYLSIDTSFNSRNFYFPLNPYNPEHPTHEELGIGKQTAEAFQQAFKTESFDLKPPQSRLKFPTQPPTDTINCGIFMVMYALIVFDTHKHTINHKFPLDPNIYRLLLATWILVRAEPRLL